MTEEPNTPEQSSDNNQMLIVAVVAAAVIVVLVLFFLFFNQSDDQSGSDGTGDVSTPAATAADPEAPTDAPTEAPADGGSTITIPTPEPERPAFTVSAADGVNVRSGPGTEFDVLGTLPNGARGEIIGMDESGAWLATIVPSAPDGRGWVAAEYVTTENLEQLATPVPTEEPTPGAAVITFTADNSAIQSGDCTVLRWQVENVSEIYVYPVGESWEDFPATGEESREVCPTETTIYEMRVVLTDGAVDTRQLTVQVGEEVANPLADTAWQLVAINVDQAPITDTVITIAFSADGTVSGSASCNNYTGPYTVDGATLTMGPLAVTAAACEDAINIQEQAYLAALGSTTAFAIEGAQLVLFDPSGTEVARYNLAG